MTLPTPNPAELPPAELWPILTPPDCPTCQRPAEVAWIGPAALADGTEVNVWRCRACPADFSIPAICWPVEDGPDCPHCDTNATYWAAIAPDIPGDLWTCHHGHEFVLTPEGLIILPEDAA